MMNVDSDVIILSLRAQILDDLNLEGNMHH